MPKALAAPLQTQYKQTGSFERSTAAHQESFWDRRGVRVTVSVLALGLGVYLIGTAYIQIGSMLLAKILAEIFPVYFKPIVFSTAEILKPVVIFSAGTRLGIYGLDKAFRRPE